MVVCETDDFVFSFDCQNKHRKWFMKQTDGMYADESELVSCVHKWEPIDPGVCRDEYSELEADLACVARAVRYFLG